MRQEERKYNTYKIIFKHITGSETVCSGLRGTIPAGVPPCSSSGLTGTGFLHLDPVWLVFAGPAVFQKTEDGQQKKWQQFWDVS